MLLPDAIEELDLVRKLPGAEESLPLPSNLCAVVLLAVLKFDFEPERELLPKEGL